LILSISPATLMLLLLNLGSDARSPGTVTFFPPKGWAVASSQWRKK
jgi:hypothetical protein